MPNPEQPSHPLVTRLRFWPAARANLCQQPALSLPSPFAALPHCSAGPAALSSSSHLQTQSSSKRIGKLFSGVVGEEVGIEVGSTVEAAVVGRRSITVFLGILGIVFFQKVSPLRCSLPPPPAPTPPALCSLDTRLHARIHIACRIMGSPSKGRYQRRPDPSFAEALWTGRSRLRALLGARPPRDR